MTRDLFAREALGQIPKLLTLLDRNPHSPTYGCFDRNFWHYKIIDFPSGMSQEFVWPLALAYDTAIPNNPYYQQPSIREWVEAGMLYAARSSRRDGSCDDYYPFERAVGAAAFSLLACIESYQLLGLESEPLLRFFERRADWLAKHTETGRLSNHQALIALCLTLSSRLVNTNRWDQAARKRLDLLLSWQTEEGWFWEYEGYDPGYDTLTISCLARIFQLQPSERLKAALVEAVLVARQFVHPDGSFGGEYGSRNTYNFFPHGFELVGAWMPEALTINDRFLEGLAAGLAPCYADDHIIGHHTWSYLLAWRDFVAERPPMTARPSGRIWLKKAKIFIDRRERMELYVALNKGGIFKLFRDGNLVLSDTQLSIELIDGTKARTAVAHLIDDYEFEIVDDVISVRGSLGWAKQDQMTPLRLIALRIAMLTIGRFFPNLIRSVLQRLLVTGKQKAPFEFSRVLRWRNHRFSVEDELRGGSWSGVRAAGIGGSQTSIYVAMSRPFQPGQLKGWSDLTKQVRQLSKGEPLRLERFL